MKKPREARPTAVTVLERINERHGAALNTALRLAREQLGFELLWLRDQVLTLTPEQLQTILVAAYVAGANAAAASPAATKKKPPTKGAV